MDPITAALNLVTKLVELRIAWWNALPEAARAERAEQDAKIEVRILTLIEKLLKLDA